MTAEAPAPVVTRYVYPTFLGRGHTWIAYREGREQFGPYGSGTTEQDAIADLTKRGKS